MNEHAPTIEKILGWGLVAGFGGSVKYVSIVIKSPEHLSNRRFVILLLANVFISSFCGLMGGLLTTTVTTEQSWTFLASGIFGYLGTNGLDIVLLNMKRKIDPNAQLSSVMPVPPSTQ